MRRPYKMKPLPSSPEEWVREVVGITRFLETLKGVNTSKPGPWKSKMKRYYAHRLRVLRKNRPKGILKVKA